MLNLFVEPCPGCFENQLQALSERPGNPVFLSNGDFTLARLIEAMSKQVYGGDLLLALYQLHEVTLSKIAQLQQSGMIGKAQIVYDKEPTQFSILNSQFSIQKSPNYINLVSLRNGQRMMTVTGGWFSQSAGSLAKECYTMVNDLETQQALRHVFERMFQ